jgi:PAS domain S-box-containing protein
MKEQMNYEELYAQYVELQLRVTRFSAIEQELINTRDQLDQELELYKRLNRFNQYALRCNNVEDLLQTTAESLIDVFETEIGLVIYYDHQEKTNDILFFEGCNPDHAKQIAREIKSFLASEIAYLKVGVLKIEPKSLDGIIHSCLISKKIKVGEQNEVVFASVVLKEKSRLYAPINERHITLFSVFAQQVNAFLTNILVLKENQEQMVQIAQSQLELKKLSMIATKTKSGVIIADNQGRIEWVNESFEKTTGYKLSEVKGQKPKDFLQNESLTNENARLKLAEALAKKENVEVTILNIAKNGNPYYNQLEIAPIFDADGTHVNFIALQKDITQEENYKNELIKSNSRFELITSNSGIGIWDWNPHTNRSVWNDVMIDMFQIPFKNDIDYSSVFLKSIHPDDRERCIYEANMVMSGEKEMIQHEYRILLPFSQEIRYIQSLVVSEKDISGNVERVVGSVVDITDTRLFEETLIEKNSELQKINKELDQFVYSVSHDLRSPLMSIKGLVSIMESSFNNELLLKQYLNLIEKSVGRLDETILEILDYSKNSRIDIKYEAFDIHDLVMDIFQDNSHLADVKVDFQLNIKGSSVVNSDKMRISTLLKNFISNAVKYRNKSLTNPLVSVEIENAKDQLCIKVMDNGEGISEENQLKVFDMFYRASSSSSGTGLGLYICKEMIEKMGGQINLVSELKKGTTIHITLPGKLRNT